MSFVQRGILFSVFFQITWESFFLFPKFLDAASKVEGLPISQLKLEIHVKVAKMVEEAENMGARVDWFDNVIGRAL